jgi:hypothetical protein
MSCNLVYGFNYSHNQTLNFKKDCFFPKNFSNKRVPKLKPTCIGGRFFIQFKSNTLISHFFAKKNTGTANEINFSKDLPRAFETKSGIKIVDFINGNGKSPIWGEILEINYVTYITDEKIIKKIDSTIDRKELFTFQHGIGEINLAFEEAVHTMKIGGKRRIIVKIKSERDSLFSGPISPLSGLRQELRLFLKDNITKKNLFLIYDIELLKIIDKNSF